MRPSSILTLATAGMATAAPAELEQRPRGNFKAEMLAAHNFFRGQHGAEPLSWKGNLASKAQDWADTCRWSHDVSRRRRPVSPTNHAQSIHAKQS